MSKKLRERIHVKKAAHIAVIINAMQIIAMASVFVYVLLNEASVLSRNAELMLISFSLLIVIWGAAIDIRDAFITRRIAEQTQMVEEAYQQLEDLNATLRSQRHDFMNHLQVVFSLTELEEYGEAMQYIERIYGDIQRVGSVLKTSIPAINALLAAKHADCSERGIRFETDIASPWTDLPVQGWEMCRVFGNLIDNACDAISESGSTDGKFVRISLGETPSAYTFMVTNNGPAIPQKHLNSIFQLGFTTKSEGHGSGLSIVAEILENHGGSISVQSDEEQTVFSGLIPKPTLPVAPHPQ